MDALQEASEETMESGTRSFCLAKGSNKPPVVPHGLEAAADNFLHSIPDSTKTSDCGIAADPGTTTALCWEAGDRKAKR